MSTETTTASTKQALAPLPVFNEKTGDLGRLEVSEWMQPALVALIEAWNGHVGEWFAVLAHESEAADELRHIVSLDVDEIGRLNSRQRAAREKAKALELPLRVELADLLKAIFAANDDEMRRLTGERERIVLPIIEGMMALGFTKAQAERSINTGCDNAELHAAWRARQEIEAERFRKWHAIVRINKARLARLSTVAA